MNDPWTTSYWLGFDDKYIGKVVNRIKFLGMYY